MLRRHLVLFSIFSGVSVAAVLMMAAYQGFLGARVQGYVAQITKCAYLSSERCGAHPLCQGDYAADPRYPDELVFRACRGKSVQQLQAESTAGDQCRRSGGSWERTPYGDYCQCPSGSRYVAQTGCQRSGS